MKKTSLPLIAVIVSVLFISCNKKPASCFSISNSSPGFGEEITLDGSCSDNAKWMEFFIDGKSIGSGTDPVKYTCDEPGDHTISMTAYSKRSGSSNSRTGCTNCSGSGKTSESSQVVHVSSDLAVSGNTNLNCDETLVLTAKAISNATYNWTGPSNFTSNASQISIPHVTGDAVGVYSVYATHNGRSSSTTTLQVNVLPVAASCTVPANQYNIQGFGQGSFSGSSGYVNIDQYTIAGNNNSVNIYVSFYSTASPSFGVYEINNSGTLARHEAGLKIQTSGITGAFSVGSGKVYVSIVNGKPSATFCSIPVSNSFGNYTASGNIALP